MFSSLVSRLITLSSTHGDKHIILQDLKWYGTDKFFTEVSRLENSLARLRETQLELSTHLKEDPEGDEDGELAKAMAENDETMSVEFYPNSSCEVVFEFGS